MPRKKTTKGRAEEKGRALHDAERAFLDMLVDLAIEHERRRVTQHSSEISG